MVMGKVIRNEAKIRICFKRMQAFVSKRFIYRIKTCLPNPHEVVE